MSCEGNLSYKECVKVLQGMKHCKSPAYDRYLLNCTNTFGQNLKEKGFENKMGASSQKKKHLTLLHKGLARLCNVNYQIPNKALANHLQVITTSIITQIKLRMLRACMVYRMLNCS